MIKEGMKFRHVDPDTSWQLIIDNINDNNVSVSIQHFSTNTIVNETWELSRLQTSINCGDLIEVV